MIMYLKKITKKDNKVYYVMTCSDVNNSKVDIWILEKDFNALKDIHKNYNVESSK